MSQELKEASLRIISEALDRYGEDHLAISFNGGKDCTVLLELYAIALQRYHASQHVDANHETDNNTRVDHGSNGLTNTPRYYGRPIRSVYIFQPDPFPEVEEFITECVQSYNLQLTRIDETQIKEGLTRYLQDNPNVQAILVGTRKTDPFAGHLQHFSPTDNGWPSFMRVNPVLDWSYADIWSFLRENHVPYCKIYDQGFTSLGSVFNTKPNPALKREDGTFSPAYQLTDGSRERAGRFKTH